MLAESFVVNSGGDFGINLGERKRHAVSHNKNFSLSPFRLIGCQHQPTWRFRKLKQQPSSSLDEACVKSRGKQLSWLPILAFAPFLALAQTAEQAPGIDSVLLAKANAGDAAAQVQVGESYARTAASTHDRIEAGKNYAAAEAWYRKAAEQNNLAGELHLAALYRDGGKGFERDMAQAAGWYHKAAEQGDADAQATLGVLYSMGQGVPQSDVEAYFWLDLAASVKGPNQEKYAANRQMIGTHITADELINIEDRVAAWKAAHPRPNAAQ